MRIGLLIYDALDTVSGGYLYDRQLVSYLASQGDQVEVVSIPMRNYSQHLLDNLSRPLYNRLVDLPVDILLQDELNHPSLFYLNRRMKDSINYTIISIVHHLRSSESHPGWQKSVYSAVEKNYLESVDGFIFNSQNTRQAVQDLTGSGKNWVVAYPAGDQLKPDITPGMIEARAHQAGPLKILFLGNVIPRKGLHILLEALGKITDKDWKLSVVGSMEFDSVYTRGIMQIVSDYEIGEKVRFYGPLGDEQLIETMRNNQVLAVPSFHEGFGIAYLEGMGFGLPAIGTTSGGAAEIIADNVDGYLVPRGDAALLAECITRFIDNRQLLATMSRQARGRYLQHPTWDVNMQLVRGFLEENINKGGVV
ncbi:MAG: glycosyltransferase family 4 protein [Anaerolineales bacterium]|nr:glycosyltransferase family 4 protein [Anaerolineales bacterium]